MMRLARLLLVLALACGSARAMTVPAWTIEELRARADVVVDGQVTSAHARIVGRRILTFYTVVVGEGTALRSHLVALPGGTVGRWSQRVPGSPLLEVGRRYRLFLGPADGPSLDDDGRRARGVIGFFRGAFLIDEQTGGPPLLVPFDESGTPAWTLGQAAP